MLKVCVLTSQAQSYSLDRLAEEGKKRGHQVDIINYLRCYLTVSENDPKIMYEGQSLDIYDVIIPRVSSKFSFYGTAIVRQFEMMKKFCVNGSLAISRAKDKLRSLQVLASKGIHLPQTGFSHSTFDVKGLINTVNGAPLVIKLIEGAQGIGVVLAETNKAAESVIEAFRGLDANILVQEFIAEANYSDIRCFVVDDNVVASMMRKACEGEFRSNLHRGGEASIVNISEEERKLAIAATKALGLHVAGVDMLRSKTGPMVLEVNSSPGLEGIEKTTGINVSEKIFEFIEKTMNDDLLKSNRAQM